MRKIKHSLCAFLCMMSLLVLATTPVLADETYTYTVRFFSGSQGDFGSGAAGMVSVQGGGAYSVSANADVVTVSGLSLNAVVSINTSAVSVGNDSKYYVKSYKVSGSDETVSAVRVTEDQDFVVAYGIKGDMVAYTVNYVDANGTALAASETFYGNVGDKPVVAYRYIEGYMPQAYNLTKTLAADEASNVFTFTYAALAGEVTEVTPENPTVEEEPENQEEQEQPAQNGQNNQNDQNANNADNAADNQDNQNDQNVDNAPADNGENPDDVIDLDEPQVPLQGGNNNNSDLDLGLDADSNGAGNGNVTGIDIQEDQVPLAAYVGGGIGIAVVAVGLIVVVIVLLAKKRKTAGVNNSNVK